MTVFAVEYAYAGDPDDMDRIRPAHKDFLESLYKAGQLRVSGPIDAADGGGALLIIQGESREDVERLMDGDPFWAEGFISQRVLRQWNVFFGGFAD